jgi:hypothetical protein
MDIEGIGVLGSFRLLQQICRAKVIHFTKVATTEQVVATDRSITNKHAMKNEHSEDFLHD